MKKQKGATWVDRTLFMSPVYIGLCTTEAQFRKELKRLNIPQSECPDWIPKSDMDAAVWHFIDDKREEKCAIVCVRKHKDTTNAEVFGMLAHEAVHVWQEIKLCIGEKEPSSEFEAYSIQSITQRLIEAYLK